MTGHAVLQVSPWKKQIQSFLYLQDWTLVYNDCICIWFQPLQTLENSFALCCLPELTHSTFPKNSIIRWRVKKSEIGKRTENFQGGVCVCVCINTAASAASFSGTWIMCVLLDKEGLN